MGFKAILWDYADMGSSADYADYTDSCTHYGPAFLADKYRTTSGTAKPCQRGRDERGDESGKPAALISALVPASQPAAFAAGAGRCTCESA